MRFFFFFNLIFFLLSLLKFFFFSRVPGVDPRDAEEFIGGKSAVGGVWCAMDS